MVKKDFIVREKAKREVFFVLALPSVRLARSGTFDPAESQDSDRKLPDSFA